eukprot:CAMPEP_0170082706 /NCGR_PEP_ID=MMETSP0019_2-20121128/18214_1 /TAXON_ID=98059 /ORGANISM="Dinobryon sp., Strain UTEXLB2267" /LENGTH=130 /DNA_ID=CAMNT_0010297685 /DNA_START=225 /DNA_END=617 /DNA_ORIENTATION=+
MQQRFDKSQQLVEALPEVGDAAAIRELDESAKVQLQGHDTENVKTGHMRGRQDVLHDAAGHFAAAGEVDGLPHSHWQVREPHESDLQEVDQRVDALMRPRRHDVRFELYEDEEAEQVLDFNGQKLEDKVL